MRDSLSKNLSYSLKVNEFAALTTRESVSRYSGHKHNDVCPTMDVGSESFGSVQLMRH